MENWKAKEFIDYIDSKFLDAKKRKLSRMSIEWGKWSREMNCILRDRINAKEDPEELKLKYVITYWAIKSQILEFCHKKKNLNSGKIKRSAKEAAKIKKMILTGKGLKEFQLDKSLVQKITG